MSSKLPPHILGIDHGTKRVGLAVARGGVRIAYPLGTLVNNEQLLAELQSVIDEEKIGLIVLGLPRNLKAQDTDQTRLVRQFSKDLKTLGVKVDFQDETTTTERAVEKGAGKADKDAWAAALILQDYLDRKQ